MFMLFTFLRIMSAKHIYLFACAANWMATYHDVCAAFILYQQLTQFLLFVALDSRDRGASHASVREDSNENLRPILPVSTLTYVEDRLYLASYTSPPTEDTLFPYPTEISSRRSPTKRSTRAIDGPAIVSKKERVPPCYFSVHDTLLYNAFHHDFGPFHIGHLYRFAVYLHDVLGAPENQNRPVVFWSKADSRSKGFPYPAYVFIANCENVRSRQCCLHSGLLHGFDPVLATTSSSCANRSSRPPTYAFPRRRILPSGLWNYDSGCSLWYMEGKGGGRLPVTFV